MPAAQSEPFLAADVRFPLHRLPELPSRDCAYYQEPFIGIITVTTMILIFAKATLFFTDLIQTRATATLFNVLISSWAFIAIACTLHLLFGNAGEIKRSRKTCYPIPEVVAGRLARGESMGGLSNINGGDGKTYCVRCFVWRPSFEEAGESHHCGTCNRCVTGFDHHCGVFGRCIAAGNLHCFYTLLAMAVLAALTVFGACSSLLAEDMPDEVLVAKAAVHV
mmetsp:Transcript_128905/g.248343  ORF Transcript_128905/g.248343 Transcript_128905/m.248343 type:complete len:222 (-) Transcript_128905:11-676(-)